MALTTLTGAISATALNNNFDDEATRLADLGTQFRQATHVRLRVQSLSSALGARHRTLQFRVPSPLWLVRLSVFSGLTAGLPTATLTATLTAPNVPDVLGGVAVSEAATDSGGVVYEDRSAFVANPPGATAVVLIPGVLYQLQLASDSATVLDIAEAVLTLRPLRHYTGRKVGT